MTTKVEVTASLDALKSCYLVLPIYIAKVDGDALNKEFHDGYIIVTTKYFHDNYIDKLSDFENLLHSDTMLPMAGMAITRPRAQYVLLKKLDTCSDENILSSEVHKLNLLISALRLAAQGSLHIHRLYFLSSWMHRNQGIETSTSLYDIDNGCFNGNQEYQFFKEYHIYSSVLEKLPSHINSLTGTSVQY